MNIVYLKTDISVCQNRPDLYFYTLIYTVDSSFNQFRLCSLKELDIEEVLLYLPARDCR